MKRRRMLLVRPKYANMLARIGPIVTEPLELECLQAIAGGMGYECHIHDPFVARRPLAASLRKLRPDMVVVSGYYPARREMFRIMEAVKTEYPETIILAGGADMEVCCEAYVTCQADVLIHSGGFTTFRRVLTSLANGGLASMAALAGICHRDETGRFIKNRPALMIPGDIPKPDRSHFYRHRSFYYYLGYGETALVKGSYGCPYTCSFCYARLLNQETYQPREMEDILDEVEGIDCETIWLVDDIFLPEEARAMDFIAGVEKRGLRKRFILYSRADLICRQAHLMPALRRAGVVNVIAGLEAVDDRELASYCKGYPAQVNAACAGILARSDIALTALFIAGPDADAGYFFRLLRWILKHRIQTYTVSVFTPLPGTRDYERYRSRLTTDDPARWDFLHLVVPPGKMGAPLYYASLWGIHLIQAIIHPGPLISCLRYRLKRKRLQKET